MLNQQFSISLLEKEISARNMRQLKTRGKMAPSHLSKIDKKKNKRILHMLHHNFTPQN
jgi:hypothetical protein